MKKIIGVFFIGIFNVMLFSQNIKNKDLKIYALSSCIQDNYKRIDDKFMSADMTNSFIFQDLSNLSINQLSLFKKFITENTNNYYEELPNKEYEIEKANLIIYKCVKFYESKELDNYIKKLLKEKSKEEES